jgi:tRNA uridine 5-carboxymethylaminomethyl modification enzyme
MPAADFDVIVVGAGHAGCEAAWAAAALGCSVGLCTLSTTTIGTMPCNPAVGGTAKGQLVREIDALGGLMGRAIDATGIQFKVLNQSRGPAVWAPRAQADKQRYAKWMAQALATTPGITIVEGQVARLALQGATVTGVSLVDGRAFSGRSVVVTTGTFLNGVIHVGDDRRPAGRVGEPPSVHLGEHLRALDFTVGRLKTGTPPRLSRASIDFVGAVSAGVFHVEHGDEPAVPLSFLTPEAPRNAVVCWKLHSTSGSHAAVRRHIARSPLYNGQIQGIGPRYCPSFEDKVMRFPDRDRHLIHLEPEGLDVDEIYVNGMSMSLPEDVQREIVAGLPGLETARFLRPGYAVEYDFVQPTELRHSLETRRIRGLFLAGQINGTSGYEEAAGQGLLAGANAALAVKEQAPFVVGRHEGYLGVMVDDLVTRGCLEPYRLFTSRAEHRLHLRADNADLRLTERGRVLGLVDDARWDAFEARRARLEANRRTLRSTSVTAPSGAKVTAEDALKWQEVTATRLVEAGIPLEHASAGGFDLATLQTEIKYGGYLRRQDAEMRRALHAEFQRIPDDFVYRGLPGLSAELVQRLEEVRPSSLGQASRIPGMTPAATVLLNAVLSRKIDGIDGVTSGA